MDCEVDEQVKIIFLGGTGRSGTNITKNIFSQHSKVATLPFEYRFIIDPDGIVDFYRGYTAAWSPYLADRRLKRLETFLCSLAHEPLFHRINGRLIRYLNRDGKMLSPYRYHGWKLDNILPDFKKHIQQLMTELQEFSFSACWAGTESYSFRPQIYHAGPKTKEELVSVLGNFIQRVINSFLDKQGKKYFAEDNTWNILLARELIDLVPQAKILHIYRDPRDVVASFIHQRWSPSETKQAALWYKSIIMHWFTVRDNLPSDSYYEFSLESLVNSTEHTLKEICHFTNLPYTTALFETDLSNSHSGRWRQDFTEDEQQMVQDILGDIIETLGYE